MYKLTAILHLKPMVRVVIAGDQNDGDYVQEEATLTKEKFDKIAPALKRFEEIVAADRYVGTRWGQDTPEDWDDIIETLEDAICLPVSSYDSELCHSLYIKSMVLTETNGKTFLLTF